LGDSMRRLIFVLITGFLTVASARITRADEEPTTAPAEDAPRIAVYDIDKVAADLGWTKDMDANLKAVAHG
jgi:hypothetical protein